MERSTGPRIYVPISMPDHSSQPTYAVLEFVGFSTPASPHNPHLLHSPAPISSPSPAMLCLPPPPSSSASSATAPPSSFYPLSVAPPFPPHHALIPAPFSHFPDANTLYLPSPSHLLPPLHHHYQQHHHSHARPYPSARLEVVNLDSPPSSPAPSSASSASRESSKEKHSHSSNPPITTHVNSSMGNASVAKPMVCFNSSPPDASSTFVNGSSPRPMVNFSSSAECAPCGLSIPRSNFSSTSEGDIMQTQISVSQTDRETIVHTHSSNFRDVVRQLTGASSDDQDLLPVTLPARLANRVNNTNMVQNVNPCAEVSASGGGPCGAGANGSGGASKEQLGLRKAPLKLHERRKSSMKNLEKLTTAYSFHGASEASPIMNPSPVTPLASDFERFCNASTPTSQGSSGMSSPIGLLGKGRNTMETAGRAGEHNQQQESGCFFSLQRPPASTRLPPSPLEKSAPPTLLSLFPESPACSPRDR